MSTDTSKGRSPPRARAGRTSRRRPTLSYRWGTAQDLPELVAHRRGMFFAMGGHHPAALDRADPIYRRWLAQRLRSGRAVARIAVDRGDAVGSAVAWLREEQPRPGGSRLRIPYILSVFVRADHRHRGIASRLTADLVAWAKHEGYPRSLLHASPFGRSVYTALGFERTWEMRYGGSYRHGPEPDEPMDALPSEGPRSSTRRRPRRRP